MHKIIVLILAVLEGRLTYITFFSERLELNKFLVLHTLIIIILYFSNKLFEEESLYYNRLSFMIPFIGIFIFLIEIFLKKDNAFNIIEDVFDFEKYQEEQKHLNTINMHEELKIMSAKDTMDVGDELLKKDFIINFNPESIKLKVKMLRKGLVDDSVEVIHYSAVEFNKITETYNRKFIDLKREYRESESKEDFDNLVDFYEKYLKSDILEGDILEEYRVLYTKLLEKRIEKEDRLEYHIRLIKMKFIQEKYDDIEEKCKEILLKGEREIVIYEFLIKTYYERDDIDSINKVYEELKIKNIELNDNIKNIFEISGIRGSL